MGKQATPRSSASGNATQGCVINVRALAILIVVMGHSIILYSDAWQLYQTPFSVPELNMAKHLINLVQMPLFFSLSGYCLVFSLARPSFDLGKFLLGKMRRLLVPFVLVGLLWMIPIKLLVGYPGYADKSIAWIVGVGLFAGQDCGNLWFLPSLFAMFVVAGVVYALLGNTRAADATLLGIGVGLLVLTAMGFKPPTGFLEQAAQHFVFFALGLLTHRAKVALQGGENASAPLRKTMQAAIGLVCLAIYATECFLILSRGLPLTHVQVAPWLIVAAFFLAPSATCGVTRLLSKDSMGLYLFHSPLLYPLFAYCSALMPAQFIALAFVGAGGLSIGLTEGLRALKCGFVIGE
ncbi:MAG: acyltransferase [Coriobacteriales bacterium]|nr:acyltransferase [Coriobacteriales bacterium]